MDGQASEKDTNTLVSVSNEAGEEQQCRPGEGDGTCEIQERVPLKISGNNFEPSVECKKTELSWNKAKLLGESRQRGKGAKY